MFSFYLNQYGTKKPKAPKQYEKLKNTKLCMWDFKKLDDLLLPIIIRI